MTKKLYIEFIFLIFLGAVTSLSLPPFNYIIINFITLSLLFAFLIKRSKEIKNKKIFFFYGWLFGFGYFITNLYWISISLTFDESFKFLIPLAIILVPTFLALFYGLASSLFLILKPKKNLSSFFLFSLIFGTIEFIRGSIFTGFPWLSLGYTQVPHSPLIGYLPIIGIHGVSFLVVLSAILIFHIFRKINY